jgi:hypothetical protein
MQTILLDNQTNLPTVGIPNPSTENGRGWSFSNGSQSIFVVYTSTGYDSIRFVFPQPQAPPVVQKVPLFTLIYVVFALVAVESGYLVVLRVGNYRRLKKRAEDEV